MAYRISKSTFQTGLQCRKALWLKIHEPKLADPIPESRQAVFDAGNAVGELARSRFVGGVLVTEDYRQSTQALETTRQLLHDPPSAIFEAALQYGGVFVRPDALVAVGSGEWDLYEVKSSTKVKPENITDVAVQTWVLEGAGLKIRRTYLMHLDNTYVYPGGEYDLDLLFTAEDVTDRVRAFVAEVPVQVATLLMMLEGPLSGVRIGKHCDNPYTCAFFGHCHAFLPAQPVTALPRMGSDLLDSLIADGIYSILDVPLDYSGLTSAQREVCEVVRSGEPRFVGDIERTLASLSYPVHFLDFETFMSALPLYEGTRPYQQIPFQWSDHVLLQDGTLTHGEFLFQEQADPRVAFIENLIATLGVSGSVIVYSSFEKSRLGDLARDLPQNATAIRAIQDRLFDLMPAIAKHVRHPDCLGSVSIKVVLPSLVGELSYDGLAISDGNTASRLYLQYQTGQMTSVQQAQLFSDLLEYCGMDTLAMVRLLEALRAAS